MLRVLPDQAGRPATPCLEGHPVRCHVRLNRETGAFEVAWACWCTYERALAETETLHEAMDVWRRVTAGDPGAPPPRRVVRRGARAGEAPVDCDAVCAEAVAGFESISERCAGTPRGSCVHKCVVLDADGLRYQVFMDAHDIARCHGGRWGCERQLWE